MQELLVMLLWLVMMKLQYLQEIQAWSGQACNKKEVCSNNSKEVIMAGETAGDL